MGKKLTSTATLGNFYVGEGSTLEIKGGIVTGTTTNNALFRVEKGSLILNGVEVIRNAYKEVIQTTGTLSGEKIILKDCVLKGRMYFPANSQIFIDNCTVYGRVGCIVLKSGYLRVRNSEFWMMGTDGKTPEEGAKGDADWAYYTNGAIFGQSCITIEALGGAYGNLPVADIDNSNTFHVAQPNIEGTLTFPVLCVNYDGNVVDRSRITCSHAYTNNITGHKMNDKGQIITGDGFLHWTTENTHFVER